MYQRPDLPAIEQHTRKLLRRAGVKRQFPTPVDEIVASAGLSEPEHSMFSEFIVDQAPEHLRRAIRRLTGPVRAVLDRKEQEIHISPTIITGGMPPSSSSTKRPTRSFPGGSGMCRTACQSLQLLSREPRMAMGQLNNEFEPTPQWPRRDP